MGNFLHISCRLLFIELAFVFGHQHFVLLLLLFKLLSHGLELLLEVVDALDIGSQLLVILLVDIEGALQLSVLFFQMGQLLFHLGLILAGRSLARVGSLLCGGLCQFLLNSGQLGFLVAD